jgi:hypothetical protein
MRLKHANLCVRDIDAAFPFLQTPSPDFRIRADRTDPDGMRWMRWVHLGTDDCYIALTKAKRQAEPWQPYVGLPGVNHLGCDVSDAALLRTRMLAPGYRESTVPRTIPTANGLFPGPRRQ